MRLKNICRKFYSILLKFFTGYEYKSIESRDKAVPNKKDMKLPFASNIRQWVCRHLESLEIEAIQFSAPVVEFSLNVMAHGDARKGKWRGNAPVDWVSSSLALYLRTRCIQHYYRWCAHLGCHQSTELTPPHSADLNGLVRCAERPNLVSARMPSRFKRALPTDAQKKCFKRGY